MLKVGVTGGIGSGKTTVCKIFEMLGIPVFYADMVAKEIMHTDFELKEAIKLGFGDQSYFDDGQLNRKHLANIVFNDESQLKKLNKIVHPATFKAFNTWVSCQTSPYILKEAALLFESGSYKLCNYSILVKAPLDLKVKRVLKRDRITANELELRMEKQFSDEQKQVFADFTVVNDEQLLIIPQVLALHEHFLSIHDHS